MRISFLHTAQVHVAGFSALLAEHAPEAEQTHHVDPTLLALAQTQGLGAVRSQTRAALQDLATADAVICTCSTLGPLVDEVALPHVLRIDRPMMEKACQTGDRIIVALCLESTQIGTLALLSACADDLGQSVSPRIVLCAQAWSAFENGDMPGYADRIASQIRSAIAQLGPVDCIVLAQASMQIATAQLADLGVPVLSSPTPAVLRAIAIARENTLAE